MATIKEREQQIIASLGEKGVTLSLSKVAEWRLWVWIMATAIVAFETVLELFRTEIDAVADKITPGTARWYAGQCRKFQNGHELLFNDRTAELYYAEEDESSRIIDIVAITEGNNLLSIKVAKTNTDNKIVPLTVDELYNFTGYVDSIKFAGIQTVTISTTADLLSYDLSVYYDPAVPSTTIRAGVIAALDEFRRSLGFNSRLYRQKLVDTVMRVKGVVTVDISSLKRKGASMNQFTEIGVADELESGYFDYTEDCNLMLISINNI